MKSNDIVVSVCCITYNHEPYIKDCLDGFLKQKTNFKFEVLIHDDASTDKTAEIIREYEEKYPDIIKPIYQTENQWSKGVKISRAYNYPRAQGEFIAICEGDDYWYDEYKLQKQVDFLKQNPECIGTIAGAKIIDYSKNMSEQIYYPTEKSRYITLEEAIKHGTQYHTATYFFRKSILEHNTFGELNLGFGDYTLVLNLALHGKVYAFHELFSVYRYATRGSWTDRNDFSVDGKINNRNKLEILYNKLNELTDNEYKEQTDNILMRHDFEILRLSGKISELKKPPYREIYIARYGFVTKIKRAVKVTLKKLKLLK